MLQEVRSPIFFTTYTTSTIMRNHARPHQVGTRTVIFRISHCLGSLIDDSHQSAFTKAISNFHLLSVRKITLHDMSHHIGHTAGSLKGRQSISKFRIHNREYRTQNFRYTQAEFLQTIQFRYNRITGAFTSGSRNSQHNSYFQRFSHFSLSDIEIPEVTFIKHTCRYGFGCINDRTTTHRQQHISLFTAAEFNAFIHFRIYRIGLHAPHQAIFNSCFPQRLFHPIQQATPYNRAAAVHDHHFPRTMLPCQCTDLHFRSFTEYKFGRTVKDEIIH